MRFLFFLASHALGMYFYTNLKQPHYIDTEATFNIPWRKKQDYSHDIKYVVLLKNDRIGNILIEQINTFR